MKTENKTEKVLETGFEEDLQKLIGKTDKLFDGYEVLLIISVLSVFTERALSSIENNFIRNSIIDEFVKLLEEQR